MAKDTKRKLIVENIREMSNALARADEELIEEFFCSLLTQSELDEMAKRWALVKELAQGTTQRKIAQSLHLSLCKITRGSKELKKENSAFKTLLDLAGYPTSLPNRTRDTKKAAKMQSAHSRKTKTNLKGSSKNFSS